MQVHFSSHVLKISHLKGNIPKDSAVENCAIFGLDLLGESSKLSKKNKKPKVDLNAEDSTIDFDMYTGACPSEARLIEVPLTAFVLRLRAILSEHPEHPVLLLLIRVAHRILSLPVDSPLMRFLERRGAVAVEERRVGCVCFTETIIG